MSVPCPTYVAVVDDDESVQLQASGSSTPVIYITAHDEPKTRELARAAGGAAYFRKTAPGQDVLEAIRRASNSKEGKP